MPAKSDEPKTEAVAGDRDRDEEIVHLQVKPGGVARFDGKAYGDRATLQVPRGQLGAVEGPVEEVDPTALPDVGERPAKPPAA